MTKFIEPNGPSALALTLSATGICIVLQFWLALTMEVNWDEFFFLSHIYNYQRGELAMALQSFHVHLLGWVTAIPGDEIDQVEAGRLFMLTCFAVTCFFVYSLSRLFASRMAALVAVLVFASAGYSIVHGASFRADPLAAFLAMASLVLIARGNGPVCAVVAGLLAGAAGMITVKVILYAPAFLGIAAWRLLKADDSRRIMVRLGVSAVSAVACFAILYFIQLGLLPEDVSEVARPGLGNAAETQVSAGLAPRRKEMTQFVFQSPLQTVLLITGLGLSIAMLRDRAHRAAAIAVLGCGATLLCLILYRNAFPYFFPFILAPSAILAAWAAHHVGALGKHALLLTVGLVAPAVAVAAKWSNHDQSVQQQLVSEVHRMFPEPVAYIDRNSMIASFPKKGFFMSTWGMQNYRRAGTPVLADVLASDTVPLVIANGPALQNAFGELDGLSPALALLDEDKETLRANYIHHWGPLWVAGKAVQATPRGTRVDILVPGTYTVEGATALIDGLQVGPGQSVSLQRGQHLLRSSDRVTLRWGTHLRRPAEPFVGTVYKGF